MEYDFNNALDLEDRYKLHPCIMRWTPIELCHIDKDKISEYYDKYSYVPHFRGFEHDVNKVTTDEVILSDNEENLRLIAMSELYPNLNDMHQNKLVLRTKRVKCGLLNEDCKVIKWFYVDLDEAIKNANLNTEQ